MAKEEAAAADEGVVEQAPTRMFSTAGLGVLVGSNVLVAVLIFAVVSMMMGGGEDDSMPDPDEIGATNPSTTYLMLEDLSTQVAQRGGGPASTVRYTILVAFAGGGSEQTAAITHWEQGNRVEVLRGDANSVLSQYSLEDVRDASFETRFEEKLLDRFNKTTYTPEGTYKIAKVDVTEIRWN